MTMKIEEIFTFENLVAAHKACRLSKQHKRGTIMFEIELGRNVTNLVKQLTNKTYRLSPYRSFTIYDPKKRLIEALPYKDRVVLMCFCQHSVASRLERHLIYDNAASRKEKGTHFAVDRLHSFMRKLYIKNKTNRIYFLKCDIRKYFQSINHEILLEQLAKVGFSADEMWFLRMIIESHGSIGLPLGNQTSQWFALLYLNGMDRLIKERLRMLYYVRYMDDFVILSEDKSKLQLCKQQIDEYVKGLKLSLNQKTQIGLLSDGIDFLGFNHKLSATGKIIKSLRGSAKSRQRKYLKAIRHYYLNDVLDDEYIDVRLASYRGHLKGTKNWLHICNRLTSLKHEKHRTKKIVAEQ